MDKGATSLHDQLVYETLEYAPQFASDGPPLETQFHAAATAGFRHTLIDVNSVDRDIARGISLRRIATAVPTAGLSTSAVTTLIVEAPGSAARSLERLKPLIDAFRPTTVVGVFRVAPTGQLVDEAAAAAAELARHNVRLAIEFVAFQPLNGLRAGLDLAKQIGSGAGVCLDVWHFLRGTAEWDVLAATSGDDLALVELNDAPPPTSTDPYFETTQRRTMCGRGEFDLGRFIAAVHETGYAGGVGLEVLSADYRHRPCSDYADDLMATTSAALDLAAER